MLINITEGFLENLAEVDNAYVERFEDLISAHVKSFHYICMTRKTVKGIVLALDTRIGNRTKNALDQIAAQSDSSLALLKKVKFHLEIQSCKLHGLIRKDKDKGGGKIWICDILYASQWCSHPVKIIGENISDGEACLQAGRHFSVINSYPPSMQRATIEMSGGCGDADTVLNQRLSDAIAPIFCFVDSDKLCQEHEGSAALKKCSNLIAEKNGIAVFYHTKARELENILPFNYIRAAVESLDISSDRDLVLGNLDRLNVIKKNSPDIYDYVDLKNGTCSFWVTSQTPATVSHYRAVEKIAPCFCVKNCDGQISPPVIKSILDKVISRMKTSSHREIGSFINQVDDFAWLDFGESVFSLAVANTVRLT